MIICYTVPEIWCVTDVLNIFYPFIQPEIPKVLETKKAPGDIIILRMRTKN